jgi:hypothetical protein
VFIRSFIARSFIDEQKVIYVSFNRSPQTVLQGLGGIVSPDHFTLIDCFTAGKGKNDSTFVKFYEKKHPATGLSTSLSIAMFPVVSYGKHNISVRDGKQSLFSLCIHISNIERLLIWFILVPVLCSTYEHTIVSRKVRPTHVPAVPFGAVEFARQPCSDLHDARILAMVMIHPSRQGCFIVSKFS